MLTNSEQIEFNMMDAIVRISRELSRRLIENISPVPLGWVGVSIVCMALKQNMVFLGRNKGDTANSACEALEDLPKLGLERLASLSLPERPGGDIPENYSDTCKLMDDICDIVVASTKECYPQNYNLGDITVAWLIIGFCYFKAHHNLDDYEAIERLSDYIRAVDFDQMSAE